MGIRKKNVEYIMKLTEDVSKKLDRLDKKTEKWEKKLRKSDKSLGRLQKKLVATFGAAAVLRGMAKAVTLMADFEQEVSTLSAITGQVGADLAFMKIRALEMGISTTKTAKEVVKAFKLIGSERPQLLKDGKALSFVTEKALILSEAARIDVPSAAKALTTALNQFEAPAKAAGNFINVLAAGSKEGAGDIPFLAAALEKVGAVAKDAKISFEQTVGVIETLAPKIKEPTTAGLNLRNVLIRLQAANLGMTSGTFNLIDALEEAKVKYKGIVKQTKLFGLINITAGKVLMNNIDEIKRYTKAVTGTNVALRQAAVNTDNLRGDTDRLKGRFQGFILGLNRGKGAITQTARGLVNIASAALSAITPQEKLSTALQQEFVDMNSLVSKATDVNTKHSDRIQLIKELQEKFPKHFDNLNAETASNLQLAMAMSKGNDELVRRIVLQETQENIDKKAAKVAKQQVKILVARGTITGALARVQAERLKTGERPLQLLGLSDEQKLQLAARVTKGTLLAPAVAKASSQIAGAQRRLARAQRKQASAVEDANAILAGLGLEQTASGGIISGARETVASRGRPDLSVEINIGNITGLQTTGEIVNFVGQKLEEALNDTGVTDGL